MGITDALMTVAVAGVTAWIVPWPKWAIEKRRAQLARRGALVNEWRAKLLNVADEGEGAVTKNAAFASLRAHASPAFMAHFSSGRRVVLHDGGEAWLHVALAEEIGRIERKWGLV